MAAPISLDRNIPFVDATLAGDVQRAVGILKAAEQRQGLQWVSPSYNAEHEYQLHDWYERHLWPFLSETHFVVAGGELFGRGWALWDTAAVDHTPTFRHWGELVAEWANQNWFARPRGIGKKRSAARRWQYLDFYLQWYLEDAIEGYAVWLDSVLRVLEAKGGDPVLPLR
jgi:hypothetical protein